MKTIDLRNKTTADLMAELSNLEESLFRLRFQNATSQLEKKSRIPQTKKDIARLKTVLKERELGLNVNIQGEGQEGK